MIIPTEQEAVNASVELGQLGNRLKFDVAIIDVIDDRIEEIGEVLGASSESN